MDRPCTYGDSKGKVRRTWRFGGRNATGTHTGLGTHQAAHVPSHIFIGRSLLHVECAQPCAHARTQPHAYVHNMQAHGNKWLKLSWPKFKVGILTSLYFSFEGKHVRGGLVMELLFLDFFNI